jgi:membrane associated rhomboid family serine protease
MRRMHPRTIIILGFVLVLLGFVIPFLMMLRIIEPNFPLSFVSFAASVSGLFLGLFGTALYARIRKGD